MTIAVTSGIDDRRAAWLADRRTAITGTELASLILPRSQLPNWAPAPIDIWLGKKGLAEERPATEAMESGREFERTILSWWAREQNVPIIFADPYTLVRRTEGDCIGATLDAWRADIGTPADAKMIDRPKLADWGEPETDQMPLYYAGQLISQMYVKSVDSFADLVPRFPSRAPVHYRLHHDPQIESEIIGTARAWWEKYIIGDQQPPIDGSPSYGKYLQQILDQRTEMIVPAAPEHEEAAEALHAAKEQLKTLEELKSLHENIIKTGIGHSKIMQGSNWKANWYTVAEAKGTDWEAVAKDIALRYARDDQFLGEDPNIAAGQFVARVAAEHQIVTKREFRALRFTYKD